MTKNTAKLELDKLWILGIIGSFLWLLSDYMISFFPNGMLRGSYLSQEELLKIPLTDAPLWRFTASTALQAFSMVLVMCGYYAIYLFLKEHKMLSILALIGGVMSAIFGAVYHTIYTTAVWVYVKSGMTEDSFLLLTGIFEGNSLFMRLCGIGFTLLGGVLFFAVVKGKTILPKWACVFNMMVVYMILAFLDFPGHISTGCIVMFTALFFFTRKELNE